MKQTPTLPGRNLGNWEAHVYNAKLESLESCQNCFSSDHCLVPASSLWVFFNPDGTRAFVDPVSPSSLEEVSKRMLRNLPGNWMLLRSQRTRGQKAFSHPKLQQTLLGKGSKCSFKVKVPLPGAGGQPGAPGPRGMGDEDFIALCLAVQEQFVSDGP